MATDSTTHRHISLFAGMGGFVIGLERAGISTLMTNDVEPSCIKTLESVFKESVNLGSSIDSQEVLDFAAQCDEVDVLSGGFPCQPFSIAGNQEGFEDLERGSRFFDILKFIEVMPAPPKILFLENVPNLKTFNEGQWLSEIISELRFAGYWVNEGECFLLNSQQVSSSPQNRERLFIIAYHSSYFNRNHFSSDFSSFVPKKSDLWHLVDRSVRQDPKLYLDPQNKHYLMIEREAAKVGDQRLFQIRRGSVRANPPGICPTLTANMGGGGHNVPFVIDDFGIRRLSVAECLLLQGFRPQELSFPDGMSDSAKLKMIGNAVNPDVIEQIAIRLKKDLIKYDDRMAVSA